jgi:hypothetical protein
MLKCYYFPMGRRRRGGGSTGTHITLVLLLPSGEEKEGGGSTVTHITLAINTRIIIYIIHESSIDRIKYERIKAVVQRLPEPPV